MASWVPPLAPDDINPKRIEAEARRLVHAAKRCTPGVGTPKFPTPWDRAHAEIDVMLDRWLLVKSFAADDDVA